MSELLPPGVHYLPIEVRKNGRPSGQKQDFHGCSRSSKSATKLEKSTYSTWCCMIQRCTDPGFNAFPSYGAKGVKVCSKWKSFSAFLKDMGIKPSLSHSIDRKDGRLGYFKENCKWSTAKEQASNVRTNRFVTSNGVSMTITQWSEKSGIGVQLISYRLKAGWSPEVAVTAPARSNLGPNKMGRPKCKN